MAFIDWEDSFCVGVKKVDDQHRQLVAHLNNLYEAMQAGKGKDALNTVMNGLVQYTTEHFATEESLMKLYDFPGYDEHKEKHEKLASHVVKLKQKFDTGEISSPLQITNFLKDWLARHIMGTDKAYGPFLNAKGVR